MRCGLHRGLLSPLLCPTIRTIRLTRERLGKGESTRSLERNAAGQLTRIEAEGEFAEELQYTPGGNIETVKTDRFGNQQINNVAEYSYDRVGRLTRVQHSSRENVSISYDPNGNIASKSNSDARYEYIAGSNRLRAGYNKRGSMTAYENKDISYLWSDGQTLEHWSQPRKRVRTEVPVRPERTSGCC